MRYIVQVKLQGKNLLNPDSLNNFCSSSRSTQCTIHCATTQEKSWEFNKSRDDAFTREIFDALWMRFEEPISTNRWDSPMFSVTPEEKLKLEDIYTALYEKKPPPANQSTQHAPTQSTSYLFELDRITQDIVGEITTARKLGALGSVKIKNSTETVNISSDINASQLNRMRRQYLNYSKQHIDTAGDLIKAPTLFVQYLNSVLSE